MLIAAAVCPHPPALLPMLGGSALADVADAAVTVVTDLVATSPDVVVVVGGPDTHLGLPVDRVESQATWLDDSAGGSLDRFGVAVHVGGSGPDVLPLSCLVGTWLLDQTGWVGPKRFLVVPRSGPADERAELGDALARTDARVALLVMGDGSPARTPTSPAAYQPDAARFDDLAFDAVESADPRRILDLDTDVAERLGVAGLAAWQVLAGAVAESGGAGGWSTSARQFTSAGVGYLVALLRPHVPAPPGGSGGSPGVRGFR